MTAFVTNRIPWRIIGWGGAVALLALPFVAMQLRAPGVDWSPGDFIFAGVLFATIGGLAELAVRLSSNGTYRAAFALGLLGMFLVIWSNLAVGIVGSEHNPPNQLFFAALLLGIIGSAVARLRPKGMSLAMFTTAAGLWAAFIAASLGATDEPHVKHLVEFVGLSLFATLFVASGFLFRKAAQDQSSSSS